MRTPTGIMIALLLLTSFPAFGADLTDDNILEQSGVRGGLVVHVHCGDGRLTAELGKCKGYLVHGLDKDPTNVDRARAHIRSCNAYGRVSIDRFDGTNLPYIDGCVNLLVAETLENVSISEVLRVLCPGGVAYLKGDDGWAKTVKSLREETDEWTHYLHGPDNNAVAHDEVVAAPYHMQWIASPRWARHHNYLSSTSAMVMSAGRVFAIVDEGSIASLAQPAKWRLVARDAYSGVLLWKKPIGPWEGHLRPFRSGPLDLARRLVAVDDRVYVTPGYNKPLIALDAASGETIHTYDNTEGTVEIIHAQGILYLITGTIDEAKYDEAQRRSGTSPAPREKRIVAIDAASGKLLWTKDDKSTRELLPSTLGVSGGRVFFQAIGQLICLDAKTGDPIWTAKRPTALNRLSWAGSTLVVHDDVVLSADCAVNGQASGSEIQWKVTAKSDKSPASIGELIAFSAKDGQELWRCTTALGYNSPADVFVADGLVWASYLPGRNEPDLAQGRNLHTGEVERRLNTDPAFTTTHHHRCYRNKATDRFILLGRTGIELIDLDDEQTQRHCWVRGACQYGVMPAAGMLYLPPHSCGCYIQSKLSGFWALAPKRADEEANLKSLSEKIVRLERGPGSFTRSNARPAVSDWPIHRHDVGRTGRASTAVPTEIGSAWQTKIGGRLTAPVIASGVLLVAQIDKHKIHALDATDGKKLWNYTAGGRIDSPPTIDRDRCYFGSADGYVYCLDLSSGKLVWRYLAAPVDRRAVAFDQLESLWPVTGSVLVHDGVVYCTAGRSSFLDGGMYLHRLDATTGELRGTKRFDSRDPRTGMQPEEIIEDTELPGTLPDVLVFDGTNLFLRDKVMDLTGNELNDYLPHLYSSAGLLDDSWWHRTYWQWAERSWGRASGWAVMSRIRPSGRILVTDDDTVFGFGRSNVSSNTSLAGYQLFRADKKVTNIDQVIQNNNAALTRHQKPAKVHVHWSREVPLTVRAMVLTKDALFAAGPAYKGVIKPESSFAADGPAMLIAFQPDNGQWITRINLSSRPVFDGMSAASGRLYLSLQDGSIACFDDR